MIFLKSEVWTPKWEQETPHIGNYVMVKDVGQTYDCYRKWANEYNLTRWHKHGEPKKGRVYKLIAKGPHKIINHASTMSPAASGAVMTPSPSAAPSRYNGHSGILCAIEDVHTHKQYIIGSGGLIEIEQPKILEDDLFEI